MFLLYLLPAIFMKGMLFKKACLDFFLGLYH